MIRLLLKTQLTDKINRSMKHKIRIIATALIIAAVFMQCDKKKHASIQEIEDVTVLKLCRETGEVYSVFWKIECLFPLDCEDIDIWEEIAKDVSPGQFDRWFNKEKKGILVFNSEPEIKNVCSCTPVRTITDYRLSPPKLMIYRKTAADLMRSDDKKDEKSADGDPERKAHQNCVQVKVIQMEIAIAEKYNSFKEEYVKSSQKR